MDHKTLSARAMRRRFGATTSVLLLIAALLIATPLQPARAVLNDYPKSAIDAEVAICMALTAKTPSDLHRCICKMDVIGERLKYSEFQLTKQKTISSQVRTALTKLTQAVQEANQVCV